VHRNKRGMTLNLKSAGGVAILKKLVARADVLVENYRPDVKDRLGIGFEAMAAINPRLVYASISGYGQDGPYRLRPGFDQIAQGMGGLMSITGLAGQGPVRVGIPVADLCAGIFCAYGITVALLEREKSGKGQWVQSSLLQAQLFMLDFQAARWLMKGEVAKQAGNNHPTSIPTGVYKTRDGYFNLAVSGHKIWVRFCEAINATELLTHPDYATAAQRSKHRDALHAELERRLQTHDTAHWIELLNQAGVPCGPIYSIDQAFADPQTQHLGIAQKVGDVAYLGQPVNLSRTPSRVTQHPPALGEHTADVLRELGYGSAEIEQLKNQGIV
jgi:crotonobetainyl-CoA:carnitine CoA-transferase CaiB-like acyl-CoA transferase